MSDKPTYSLDSNDDGDPSPKEGGRDAGDGKVWRIDEDEPTPPAQPEEAIELEVSPLDVCPNCGANMPGPHEVVCLRCGFDLESMKPLQTDVKEGEDEGQATGADDGDEDEAEKLPPVSGPGRGGLEGPAIVAGICLLVMTVAYLVRAPGLFTDPVDSGTDGENQYRLVELFKFYVFTALFAGSTWGGLFLVCRVDRRELGDGTLAAVRMLAISSICLLVTLISLPEGGYWWFVEFSLQFILMAAIFTALSVFFFRLQLRQTVELGVVVLVILGIVFLASTITSNIVA